MNRIFRSAFVLSFLAAAAAAQSKPSSPAEKPADSKAAQSAPAQASPRKVDHAAAYYHYTLAHMYEEQITIYGRSELANKAMEEYRLAIEADDQTSGRRCERLAGSCIVAEVQVPGLSTFDLCNKFSHDGSPLPGPITR